MATWDWTPGFSGTEEWRIQSAKRGSPGNTSRAGKKCPGQILLSAETWKEMTSPQTIFVPFPAKNFDKSMSFPDFWENVSSKRAN